MSPSSYELRDGVGHAVGLPEGFAAGFTTRKADAARTRGVPIARWLARAIGAPAAEASRSRQVHGKNAVEMAAPAIPGGSRLTGEADALLTRVPGRMLVVESADCVPIVLVAPKEGLVAVIHAGWRGTADRVVDVVLDRFTAHGASPADLHVFFGPAISRDRYEVGPEVVQALETAYRAANVPAEATRPGEGDKTFVDLAAFHRALLRQRGVPADRISENGPCTASTPELFPSYRRDGKGAGRILTGVVHLG